MFYINALNLNRIGGGNQIKQGDFGSTFTYKLADEKNQELNIFDQKTAYVNLVLDNNIVFTTTVIVEGSTVTFNIDKAIPTGLYFLEIKIDSYIFPSDRQTIILVTAGATAYDLKDLVPNYDTNMTISSILSDLSQKGIDITDLKTKMNAIYDNALADHAEITQARGGLPSLDARLDGLDAKDTDLQNQINTNKTSITTTGSRIDNLIANAGNGTVPSELTDIRVANDGTVYTTAGNAIRTQFLELNNDLDTAAENIGLVRPNLLNVKGQNRTSNGITWTFNLDGTVTVNGTATFNEYNKTTITLPAGEYYVSGAPSGAKTNTYHIMYTNGLSGGSNVFFEIGNVSQLTLSESRSIDFYIRIMSGTTVDNIVFKPMISKKEYGVLPYLQYKKLFQLSTVPSELTDIRVANDGTVYTTAGNAIRAQFLELNNDLDTAAENIGLVRPNLLNVKGQNRTSNGITWTFNLDGTVTVNGTATFNEYNKTTITLPAGEYYVSGAPSGAKTNTYHIMYTNGLSGGSNVFFEIGNVSPLTLSESRSIDFYIRIMSGTTVDNIVFKPMISKKEYGVLPYLQYKKLFQIPRPISSNWSGAVANFIGDSITYGAYGNYVEKVKAKLGLSVARNYGIGGCLMASSSQDQLYRPVVSRWNEMEEADIIFVFAGTNDYSHQVPIGDATSTDITTFNGALNTIMDGLRDKYPDKLVIFSSILHRYNDKSLPIKADNYREAIRERCEAKQFVFYDAYRYSGFNFIKGYYDKVLTTDGLHPNQKGAEILARKISAFINSQ